MASAPEVEVWLLTSAPPLVRTCDCFSARESRCRRFWGGEARLVRASAHVLRGRGRGGLGREGREGSARGGGPFARPAPLRGRGARLEPELHLARLDLKVLGETPSHLG